MQAKADVRVVCRFRPLRENETETIERAAPGVPVHCVVYDEAHVEVLDRYEGVMIGDACTSLGRDDRMKVVANRTLRDLGKDFTLDAVLAAEQTQEDVYELVGAPVVHNVIEGYNGTVLAYGQTGSGKTHSMIGPEGGTQGFFGGAVAHGDSALTATMTTTQQQQQQHAPSASSLSAAGSSSTLHSPASMNSQGIGAHYAMRGLVPRVVEGIFSRLAEFDPAERTWSLHLSIYEIYREEIIDLLGALPPQRLRALRGRQKAGPSTSIPGSHTSRSTSPATAPTTGPSTSRPRSGVPSAPASNIVPPKVEYRIREDIVGGRGVYVESLECLEVVNAAEVLTLIHEAMLRRRTSATNANETSSRSHSLVVLTLEQLDKSASPEGVHIASRLNLVDLAGSEKVGKTNADGDRLKEAQTINLSLTLLGNVIHRLTDGRSGYIPYRDSKLTRLLQDSLGGNSITTLLCHCSTSMLDREETLSTLRFAQRAKRVRNKPRLNRDLTAREMGLQLAEAQQRVDMLEKELRLHNEVRNNLRDRHAKDKDEAEKRQQSLVDSLRREIEQLREELRLKEGELVHEKDRVAFQRREKEQLSRELDALRAAHANESAALEQALSDAQQQNQKLASDLNDLRREMQDYRANRSASPAHRLSPRVQNADANSARRVTTRDAAVNTESLSFEQMQRLTALLDRETTTDNSSESGPRRLLASDEMQRAVHTAGTLIASIAHAKSGAAAARANSAELQAAVEVLAQVIAAIARALAADEARKDVAEAEAEADGDGASRGARRTELQEALDLARRLLALWLECGGALDATQLGGLLGPTAGASDGVVGNAHTVATTADDVAPGHLLSRNAMTPLVRTMESVLALDLGDWAAETDSTSAHGTPGILRAWAQSMQAAYGATSAQSLLEPDALLKARTAMTTTLHAQCVAAKGLPADGGVARWLETRWVDDVFGSDGLVATHSANATAAVWSALHAVVAEQIAEFTTDESAVQHGLACAVAQRVEAHLSAAVEQCQLDGTTITPAVLEDLFAELEPLLCEADLEDHKAHRHSRVAQWQAALQQTLRDTSKKVFRQQDALLKETLSAHAAALMAELHQKVADGDGEEEDEGTKTQKQAEVAAVEAMAPLLLATALDEATRLGPQQHKQLMRRLRVVGKEACAAYEVAASAEDTAMVDTLLARRRLLCSKMQVVTLLQGERAVSETVPVLNREQLDKLALQLNRVSETAVAACGASDTRARVTLVTPYASVLTADEGQQLATFLSAYTPGYAVSNTGSKKASDGAPCEASYVERQIQALLVPDLARCFLAHGTAEAREATASVNDALVVVVKAHMRELVFPGYNGPTCLALTAANNSNKNTTAVGVGVTHNNNAARLLHALAQALQAHIERTTTAADSNNSSDKQARRERIADLLSALAHVVSASTNHNNSSSEVLTETEMRQVQSLANQLTRVIDGADAATLLEMERWLDQCLRCADARQRDAAIRAALSALGLSLTETELRNGEAQLTTVSVHASIDVLGLGQQLALIVASLGNGSATTSTALLSPLSADDVRRLSGVSFQSDSQSLLKLPPHAATIASVHDALLLLRHVSVPAPGSYDSPTHAAANGDGRALNALQSAVQTAEERQLFQHSSSTRGSTVPPSPSASTQSPPPLLLLTGPVPASPSPPPPAPALAASLQGTSGRRLTTTTEASTLTEPFMEADVQLQRERDAHMRQELATLLALLGVPLSEVCGLQPDEVDLLEATLRVREEVAYLKKIEEPAQSRALQDRQRALTCIYDAVKDTNTELEALRVQLQTRHLMAQLTAAATGNTPTPASADPHSRRPVSDDMGPSAAPVATSGNLSSRVAQNLQRQMDLASVLATPRAEREVDSASLHTPTRAAMTTSTSTAAAAVSPDLRRLAARYENPLLRARPDVNALSAATPDGKPSHVRTAQCLASASACAVPDPSSSPSPTDADHCGSPLSVLASSRRHSSVARPSTTASLIALATVSNASPNKYVNPSPADDLNVAPDSRRMRLDALGNEGMTEAQAAAAATSRPSSSATSPSASRKADLAPSVTHQCLVSYLDWTEKVVVVFHELQRQAEMARLRSERLDELLYRSRDERDDCRQELDALKLVVAALRQENEQMRHVLHDLNIDLEAYVSNLAYQERLNKVLAEEAERQRGAAERLRTTAEQQEFCEMGAVELAMKSEDTLAIEIGLRQAMTYSSAELAAKKRAHLSKGLKKLDTFCQRMLGLLQLRPCFNTGTLESQRLNLLQGLGDLMERIANAKESLCEQQDAAANTSTSASTTTAHRTSPSNNSTSVSFPTLAQRAPTTTQAR